MQLCNKIAISFTTLHKKFGKLQATFIGLMNVILIGLLVRHQRRSVRTERHLKVNLLHCPVRWESQDLSLYIQGVLHLEIPPRILHN
jgi:hypothetical protein